MRSALLALAAATTFLVGAVGLGDEGRPVPDRIEAGATGQRATEFPDFSLRGIQRFEEVEPLVHVQPIGTFGERDEEAPPINPDLGPPGSIEPDPPASSSSSPPPSSTPAEAEPSPSPSPAPSPSPSPLPSPTPSPTQSPAP